MAQVFRKIGEEGAKSFWGTEHDENIYSFPGVEFLTVMFLIMEKNPSRIVDKVRNIDTEWF